MDFWHVTIHTTQVADDHAAVTVAALHEVAALLADQVGHLAPRGDRGGHAVRLYVVADDAEAASARAQQALATAVETAGLRPWPIADVHARAHFGAGGGVAA